MVMKHFVRCGILITIALLAITHSSAQDAAKKDADQKRERSISIKLKTGETVTGNLVKADPESVDFTVKNVLQTIALDDIESISFVSPTSSTKSNADLSVLPMTKDLRPTILYREKAKYTDAARDNGVQGTVVLQVVFHANGKLTNFKVVRGLPDGLTESAIAAAKKIRFEPAMKDGKPVSVRGTLEFTFNL
ncbi:MAG TPA: TonB family protein [Blastocatellia bacterium]|nr:TonB family protein [Blastocatellia bacterium]